MSTRSLTDDLMSIACASLPGEMKPRVQELLDDPDLSQEEIAEGARRVIGVIRLHAKSMDYLPPAQLSQGEASALGLHEWISTTKQRADELRKEADEFEQLLVAVGVLDGKATERKSLEGIWRGVRFSDEEIAEAKKSLFRDIDDEF